MSNTKIYPKGLRTFAKHDNAPDFVKGTLIVTPNELVKFCKENEGLLTEYNGTKQLKCQILEGDNGLYFVVDTWKHTNQAPDKAPSNNVDDLGDGLPFW